MQQRDEIHVIGGGLAGLTAAAFVARHGLPVVVHERRGRLGGRATTDERAGYHFNQGPHALYRAGAGRRVLRELDIDLPGVPATTKAMALFGGALEVAPTTPTSMVRSRLLGARDKAEFGRFVVALPHVRADDLAGTSVAEWLDGSLDRPRSRAMAEALVRLSTYVNAPAQLSAEVAVTQIQMGVRSGVTYLDHGWQRIVDSLAAQPGIRFEDGRPVSELPDAAAVIVAVGGPAATSALVGHDAAPGAGPAATVSCLDLGLRGQPPHDFVLGIDEPLYLSKHSTAAGHAPAGRSAVLLAEYLADGVEPDRNRLERLARIAGITDDVVETQRYLHRMVAITAIPTATAGGFRGRPESAVRDRPGVFVAGDWVGPTGHLADASLASARAAALAAVAHVEHRAVVG